MGATSTKDLATMLLSAKLRRLIAGRDSPDAALVLETTQTAWLEFRLSLETMVGREGCRIVFSRALALSKKDIAWLSALTVNADGLLAWSSEATKITNTEALEGCVALFEQLISLLNTFIGSSLTLRIIDGVWPGLRVEELAAATAKEIAE